MATPPTVSDYQQSTFSDVTAGNEVTPALTWSAGDYIVAIGITEDNATATLNVPTATGLTFAAWVTSNTNLNCKVYVWDATAGAGGSQAVTATRSDANSKARGLAVFAFSSSDGRGATGTQASGSGTTQSLIRASDNSAVIYAIGDFSANADVTVTSSPAGGATQRVATTNAGCTSFILSWTDQGAAGTTSYGFTNGGAGLTTIGYALEIKGTAAGATAWGPLLGLGNNRLVVANL